jgi:hypothetical protein
LRVARTSPDAESVSDKSAAAYQDLVFGNPKTQRLGSTVIIFRCCNQHSTAVMIRCDHQAERVVGIKNLKAWQLRTEAAKWLRALTAAACECDRIANAYRHSQGC